MTSVLKIKWICNLQIWCKVLYLKILDKMIQNVLTILTRINLFLVSCTWLFFQCIHLVNETITIFIFQVLLLTVFWPWQSVSLHLHFVPYNLPSQGTRKLSEIFQSPNILISFSYRFLLFMDFFHLLFELLKISHFNF